MVAPDSIDAEAWQSVIEAAVQLTHSEAHSFDQIERMQRYFSSGDPILMAEAIVWVQAVQSQSESGRESESINSSIDSTSGQFCSSDLNQRTSSGSVSGS